MKKEIELYSFMGVNINSFTIDSLMSVIYDSIIAKDKKIIAHHNIHSMALTAKDQKMREFYLSTDCVHIDGMFIVLIGKILGYPLRAKHRITYVDLTPCIMNVAAQKNWRVCYIGSKPGIGERAAEILMKKHTGLKLITHHGYFDVNSEKENDAVLDFIHKSQPSILMVGMGMPRQEKWIFQNFDKFPDSLILPCGAALDYEAGIVPTPPRWVGRFALEWLFRLLAEPRRLWSRYLVEPWSLIIPFLKEFWTKRVKETILT